MGMGLDPLTRLRRQQIIDVRVEPTPLPQWSGVELNHRQRLFLPGALLVTIGAKLLAALMFVNFRFTTFFQ
jgi:hypothetical protein